MAKDFPQVYQFKIILDDTHPPVWRRIQVPETYTFWDLHIAIQDAMGWTDSHLHEFYFKNPATGEEVNIGLPDDEGFDEREILPDWEANISDYFSMKNRKAKYVYDFGDNWEHRIRLEKILPREGNIDYPTCIAGQRACPPEDCGGIGGYEDFLEIIRNPNREEHKEMLAWVGGKFDPEHFGVEEISFDDPERRRKIAFG